MSHHQVTFSIRILGQTAMNVVKFENLDGLMTNLQMANELQAQWIPKLTPLQTNTIAWIQLSIIDINAPGTSPYNHALPAISGGSSFQIVHPCVAYLFSLRTGLTGRKKRGRFYLPGVHANNYNTSTGQLTPAGVTACQTASSGILSRYGPGSTSGMMLEVGKVANGGPFRVTDVLVRNNLGIQRRRNIGVGI